MDPLDYGPPEWLRTIRGAIAYALHIPLHWLSFALLPYAGDWTYRHERRGARRALRELAEMRGE